MKKSPLVAKSRFPGASSAARASRTAPTTRPRMGRDLAGPLPGLGQTGWATLTLDQASAEGVQILDNLGLGTISNLAAALRAAGNMG